MSPMRFIKSLSISIPKRDYIPTRNQEIETIRNIIRFFDNETKNENNCCKSMVRVVKLIFLYFTFSVSNFIFVRDNIIVVIFI